MAPVKIAHVVLVALRAVALDVRGNDLRLLRRPRFAATHATREREHVVLKVVAANLRLHRGGVDHRGAIELALLLPHRLAHLDPIEVHHVVRLELALNPHLRVVLEHLDRLLLVNRSRRELDAVPQQALAAEPRVQRLKRRGVDLKLTNLIDADVRIHW